jgi:hypothetical protein
MDMGMKCTMTTLIGKTRIKVCASKIVLKPVAKYRQITNIAAVFYFLLKPLK